MISAPDISKTSTFDSCAVAKKFYNILILWFSSSTWTDAAR